MKKNKEKKYNESSFVFATVMIIILILFVLGILIINKKHVENNINMDNNIIENNDYIKDAIHITKQGKYTGYCSAGLTHFLDINVAFPKLKLNKENAKKLNDIILTENQKEIDFVLDDNVDVIDNKHKTSLYINTSYNYTVKNKILYISLENNYLFDSNNEYKKVKNYFYDIDNDKILNFETAIKNTDLKLEDFKKLDKNNIINSYDECEEGLCGLIIKDDTLIPYVEENINK